MIRITTAGKLQLAVFASGRGSNFDAIADRIDSQDLWAVIRIVVTDRADAPVLEKARKRGLEAIFINPREYPTKDDYERTIAQILKTKNVDVIVLAGYMRLVGNVLLKEYPLRILNIHPSLLPSFPGLNAQKQALEYGVKYSGCTVHIVDHEMDTGPIIMQAVVPVLDHDSEESLAQRILAQEHQIYWQSLQLLAEGRVFLEGRRVFIADKPEGSK
ncbi:MAG: phosphoribosylglycinamide formyltransferase [Syntrophomonadaceae bacterium]|jgi:phosphoribosylglycinamide formyltransferase-1